MKSRSRHPSSRRAEIRRQVEGVLSRAPAYSRLDAARRRQLAVDLRRLVSLAMSSLVRSVDFPAFVAGLIAGTFEAIVGASIQQMEAYADLLADATASADAFAAEVAGKPVARQRQQLLATMVLMGINRIVVTNGTIRARSVLRRRRDTR